MLFPRYKSFKSSSYWYKYFYLPAHSTIDSVISCIISKTTYLCAQSYSNRGFIPNTVQKRHWIFTNRKYKMPSVFRPTLLISFIVRNTDITRHVCFFTLSLTPFKICISLTFFSNQKQYNKLSADVVWSHDIMSNQGFNECYHETGQSAAVCQHYM